MGDTHAHSWSDYKYKLSVSLALVDRRQNFVITKSTCSTTQVSTVNAAVNLSSSSSSEGDTIFSVCSIFDVLLKFDVFVNLTGQYKK